MANTKGAQSSPRLLPEHSVHKLKITLSYTKPPIWRRLEVPSSVTLEELHDTIQAAFGWEDYHMWAFETKLGEYGIPHPELDTLDASAKSLLEVAAGTRSRISYTYDFGDNWKHEIVVEGVTQAEAGVSYPRCLTGKRACPPEDCGGAWGYDHLLDVLADPQHEEHADRLDWLGLDSADQFDPAAFDLAETNAELSSLAIVLLKP